MAKIWFQLELYKIITHICILVFILSFPCVLNWRVFRNTKKKTCPLLVLNAPQLLEQFLWGCCLTNSKALILKVSSEWGLPIATTKPLTALIHSKAAAEFLKTSNYHLPAQVLTASCKWTSCLNLFWTRRKWCFYESNVLVSRLR